MSDTEWPIQECVRWDQLETIFVALMGKLPQLLGC